MASTQPRREVAQAVLNNLDNALILYSSKTRKWRWSLNTKLHKSLNISVMASKYSALVNRVTTWCSCRRIASTMRRRIIKNLLQTKSSSLPLPRGNQTWMSCQTQIKAPGSSTSSLGLALPTNFYQSIQIIMQLEAEDIIKLVKGSQLKLHLKKSKAVELNSNC